MTSEQWVFAGASAALAFAFVRGVLPIERRTLTHPAIIGAGVLFLLSLVVRALFVQPTLVHADVAAPELVDCILDFPLRCTNRGASYGQYGFWLLGAMSQILGRDLNAVFASMQIIGALDVALLAILAYRLSGSPYAALFGVAIIGTNPIFMRVAASEDLHNLGLCLGLVAFIAMDVYAVTRRLLALAAVVLALGLMVHTRQTFYVFAPSVFLMGLARGGGVMLKDPWYWGAGLIVLAALLQRALGGDSGDLVFQMIAILSEPRIVPDMLRYHALLDFTRFGLLPVLTIAAIVWAFSAGGVARATAAVFALSFLLTYPPGMPSPGVELAQRLGTHALGMLLCAMGMSAFVESRVRPSSRAAFGLAVAVVMLALPPYFPGWRTVNELTPIHREYLGVKAAAASLPSEFTQIILPTFHSNSYGGARYAGLLGRMGKKVHPVLVEDIEGMPRPWLFLENIECWTYSFYEVIGIEKQVARARTDFEYRWDHVLFGHRPSPVRPPAEVRPQCAPFLRNGTPIGPPYVITDVEDDPPFLFYAATSVPIRFYEIGDAPRVEAGG